MKRRVALLAVAAAALLAGCETTGNIEPAALGNLGAGKALLVMTVTHDWGPPAPIFGAAMGGGVRFHVELRGPGLEGGSVTLHSLTDSLSPTVQTPFEQLWGRIYVRELPAGTYELVSWRLEQNTGVGWRSFTPKLPPPVQAFTLQAGNVTYIGNVHAGLAWGKNMLGMPLLAGGLPALRNEATRDLPLVYKSYPQLEGRVDVAPLKQGPWLTQPSDGGQG